MLKTRVIPTLLLKDWGIVKTVKFSDETYIGCPINAVRVFNAMHVDELILLDIIATQHQRAPLTEIALQITEEATMPITVGGGLTTLHDIRETLKCGADKVCINTKACEEPQFIREASARFGSQCIVVSIDAKRTRKGSFEVYSHSGKQAVGIDPVSHAVRMQQLGAGEILLNSIDRDGTWEGYDLELLRDVTNAVSVPVIACGGAGQLQHFTDAVDTAQASAVSAGSFFLFHGRRRGITRQFSQPRRTPGDVGTGENSTCSRDGR